MQYTIKHHADHHSAQERDRACVPETTVCLKEVKEWYWQWNKSCSNVGWKAAQQVLLYVPWAALFTLGSHTPAVCVSTSNSASAWCFYFDRLAPFLFPINVIMLPVYPSDYIRTEAYVFISLPTQSETLLGKVMLQAGTTCLAAASVSNNHFLLFSSSEHMPSHHHSYGAATLGWTGGGSVVGLVKTCAGTGLDKISKCKSRNCISNSLGVCSVSMNHRVV